MYFNMFMCPNGWCRPDIILYICKVLYKYILNKHSRMRAILAVGGMLYMEFVLSQLSLFNREDVQKQN